MKRTTIFLDEGTERELHAVAKRQRRPMASVVREAIERYVVENRNEPGDGLHFIAVGRSGHSDTAERHEEMLFDTLPRRPPAERSAFARRPAALPGPADRPRPRTPRRRR